MKRLFGHVPGIPVGEEFKNRRALHDAGVHRPTQAGISGSQEEGADSIVVSGGYEDDHDSGDRIIYTGFGGNDPSTGEQVSNQQLTYQNKAIAVGQELSLPVPVVRGHKWYPQYAPVVGYR